MKIEERFKNIFLVAKRSENNTGDIKDLIKNDKLCICDFYVNNSELGTTDDSGATSLDNILIIDHHMKIPEMKCHITSTNIAANYVRLNGALPNDYTIAINHTDADSILSSLIMSGEILPSDIFVEASKAADHTGGENVIADLLQSLEEDRNLGNSIDVFKKIMLHRVDKRAMLKKLYEDNKFKWFNNIAYAVLEEAADAAFTPALLPNAEVIVLASHMPAGSSSKWRMRIRLGNKAEGIALNELNLPDFGGRWNAGSTSRNDGTDIEPEEYIRIIDRALNRKQ